MSHSSDSTEPNTPKVGGEDAIELDEGEVFFWLRPLNEVAGQAFDKVVNLVIKKSTEYCHHRQFLHTDFRRARDESAFTDDEDLALQDTPAPLKKWTGALGLRLNNPPRDPTRGWCIGIDPVKADLLLAPHTQYGRALKVAGHHATLELHKALCRVMLRAKHTVTTGQNGACTFREPESRVLEDGEIIIIGACVYKVEYTNHFYTASFTHDLTQCMRAYCDPMWAANGYLTSSSVGRPNALGKYYCSPMALAQGTFGKVSAGWTKSGDVVAIKMFKTPVKSQFDEHVQMMNFIGKHVSLASKACGSSAQLMQDNIAYLLHSDDYFSPGVSDAYCVYAPLAVASLTNVIQDYSPDIAAQLALFLGYLTGLAFLHNEKGIMHRDINPNNLAVTSLYQPKGIIIDFDAASTSPTSTDHGQGTIPFLAPEIMAWKLLKPRQKQPAPYEKSVDVWALGLSMYALHVGRSMNWRRFATTDVQHVTGPAYRKFQDTITQNIKGADGDAIPSLLLAISRMTMDRPEHRVSASEAHAMILEIKGSDQGNIVQKRKRSYEP
ncbi:MAG: hypothetical protein L6R35_007004 [Caloplaca aegaea]|nr:MAG: hypothetical protein L6R35_007004 [Caloplaca aegaea]